MKNLFPRPFRQYARLFIFPVLLISVVVLTYLTAMHAPTPHKVPIGIAGPGDMVIPLAEGFQSSAGDQFSVSTFTDAETARKAVEEQEIVAALVLMPSAEDRAAGEVYERAATVPAADREHAAVIYVAAAAGQPGAAVGMVPLQTIAAQAGVPVMVRDLVPLNIHDLAGNGQMWFTLGVTLAAYVGVTMLNTAARDLMRLRTLALALPIYGTVLGILLSALLTTVWGLDAVMENILPLLVTSILNVVAVGLGAAVICRVVGRLGTLVVMFVFVGIGLTSSGAAIPHYLVPGFFRFFNPFMPYGATSRAVRNSIYFDHAELWQNWTVLGAWIFAMGVGLWLSERWHPMPDATPVVVSNHAGSAASPTPRTV